MKMERRAKEKNEYWLGAFTALMGCMAGTTVADGDYIIAIGLIGVALYINVRWGQG